MSYDFLMLKPIGEIGTPGDICEDKLAKQNPAGVAAALGALFPRLQWRREADGGWFGRLDGEDGWYQFRLPSHVDWEWSIQTSRLATTRALIPVICKKLNVIAFDGQAMRIVRAD